ncbi:MAG TPA: metal ABC transporter ATP-binding protein [Firmicutes bacterium]|nr:metal ABC transporter ATP-binding protein [Bacillota bacterium]
MREKRDLAVEIHNLTAGYDGRPVLRDVSWEVPKGSIAAVIGPNGGGKSTLLKTAVGLLRPLKFEAIKLLGLSPAESREKISYLPQREEVDWSFPITVWDVILQGRLVRKSLWARYTKEDYQLAREAAEFLGVADLSQTQIGSLSGGQRQRVFLARALVQEAELILLDEPTTGLDAKAQHELAALFQRLAKEGKTIVAATHDLECVTECFDQILALDGKVLAQGGPEQVLTEENMVELFARHLPRVLPGGEVKFHD